MEHKTEYLSLYDYLGKPAGEELGLAVSISAKEAGIIIQSKQISNPKYTGTILMYPKTFLEWYFREPDSSQIEDMLPKGHDWMGNLDDDDLPF